MSYITKRERELHHKKFIQEMKEERKIYEESLNRQENIMMAQLIERRKEDKRKQEERESFIHQAKQFVTYSAKTMPYSEYLIAYDIACNNSLQIESDIARGKITINQFKKVYAIAKQYINNLCDCYYDALLQ